MKHFPTVKSVAVTLALVATFNIVGFLTVTDFEKVGYMKVGKVYDLDDK